MFDLIDISEETVKCMEDGFYIHDGKKIPLDIPKCREVKVYDPEWNEKSVRMERSYDTVFSVTSDDTTSAILKEKESERTAVLNFASAMHPGGGFLTGARAQEEAISRVSTLYYSIASKKGYVMYQENRKRGGRFYLEYMLFSPHVEFFRTSDFSFLPKPVVTSVLTVPAPNRNRFSLSETELDEVLSKRIERMLSMALDNGKKNLILGAWGCGVFGNDPYQIASAFKKALTTTFDRAFSRVTFAVLPSKRDNNYEVFKEVFGA